MHNPDRKPICIFAQPKAALVVERKECFTKRFIYSLSLLLAMIFPVQVLAIGFDGESSSFGFGTITCSVSHTTGSLSDGIMWIAVTVGGDGTTISTPTIGGSSTDVTLLGTELIADLGRISVFYKLGPSSGTTTIAVTLGSSQNCGISVSTYSGVNQLTPTGAVAKGHDASAKTDPSLPVSGNSGNTIVDFLWFVGNESRTAAVGNGQTERGNNNFSYGVATSTQAAKDASTTMSWNLTADGEWGLISVAMKEADRGTHESGSARPLTPAVKAPVH